MGPHVISMSANFSSAARVLQGPESPWPQMHFSGEKCAVRPQQGHNRPQTCVFEATSGHNRPETCVFEAQATTGHKRVVFRPRQATTGHKRVATKQDRVGLRPHQANLFGFKIVFWGLIFSKSWETKSFLYCTHVCQFTRLPSLLLDALLFFYLASLLRLHALPPFPHTLTLSLHTEAKDMHPQTKPLCNHKSLRKTAETQNAHSYGSLKFRLQFFTVFLVNRQLTKLKSQNTC